MPRLRETTTALSVSLVRHLFYNVGAERGAFLREKRESVMRLRAILFVLFAAIVASSAQANMCMKCDQTTGYACFNSRINATHSGCDTPSNAGCALWGSCTVSEGGGDDCADGCPFDLGNAAPMTNDLEVASVTIALPASRAKSLPTTNAQTAI